MNRVNRLLVAAAMSLAVAPALPAETVLQAVRVKGNGPILDVESAMWKQAKPVKVTMLPQTVATPNNPKPAVSELKVRAAHNGQWLALLIEWKDPTKSDRIVTDEFGDQVAVEFPIQSKPGAAPSPMMGNPGGRVNILQWRAAFQHDIDKGEPQVRDLYPNAMVDLYPDQVLRATDARPYTGALGVDNPISRPRASPVLDQMAEGFGSMTVKPDQHADGKGV
ncbi:MAG TPA: ethylbenzene dehydrogenase-related protein, partial [Burkholderiales bacterium]|nr:ethylbenzene dehydrogenase-related protein [Burkholderiales bacterium]